MTSAVAYPRAAIAGNPSDGYNGKTIAFTFKNFRAEAFLEESDKIAILPGERDFLLYDSPEDLQNKISRFGYYGGIRLVKAALFSLFSYVQKENIVLPKRCFSVSYKSDIPDRVGLAGSSAIIIAVMRAVCAFYGIEVPNQILANIARDAENRHLGISAGLQDRVSQCCQGLVYMDFALSHMERCGYGKYVPLPRQNLSNVYIAYSTRLSEGSEVMHNNLRERYDSGDCAVHRAMDQWASFAEEAQRAVLSCDMGSLSEIMDRNFDLRKSLCRISGGNLLMVKTARDLGASAKFTGSGGAIVGIYPDEETYRLLVEKLSGIGAKVFKPEIV